MIYRHIQKGPKEKTAVIKKLLDGFFSVQELSVLGGTKAFEGRETVGEREGNSSASIVIATSTLGMGIDV